MTYRLFGQRAAILGRLFLKKMNDKVLHTGLTGSQWSVIYRLLQYKSLTQREICAQLSVEASTASKMIQSMEATGWLQRSVDPQDKREKRVELTDKTRANLTFWLEQVEILQKKSLQGISPEEINVFDRVLDRMIQNLRDDTTGES